VIDRQLLPLDIKARDRSVEAEVRQSLLRSPLMPGAEAGEWRSSQALSVGLLVAHRRQKSFLFGEPFSFAPGSVDGRAEYTAGRLTADYVRRNVRQVIAVSLIGTLGLGGTQSRNPFILDPSENFTAALAQLTFAQRLGRGGLELRGRLVGQYAPGVLYSGERLSIGGVTTVRGYRESLYLVDRGIIGSVELAYPFSVSGRDSAAAGTDWGAFTASIFGDAAGFENAEGPRLGQNFIASAGAALAWTPGNLLEVAVSYGHRLRDVPLPQNKDLQDRGINFRITVHPAQLF
jgi:hemolysin activation/secretion protein